MRHVKAVAALAVVGTVALATPADASTALASRLTLSITPESSTGGPGRTVTLTCEPTGGTHPDAAAACADLIKANGDIKRIPPAKGNCLPVEIRVIAKASGIWQGRQIAYSQSFTNDCYANKGTGGHVFHF